MTNYHAIIIGGGLSGLTAASLLAKRKLKVAVIDISYQPGGSCGIFKRKHVTFDQGSAMLYGFGEKGFNAHRFVFNALEEPIDIIQHDLLYCVNFKGKRIRFYSDIEQFCNELAQVFPNESENIKRFYIDMLKMYQHVMVDNQTYTTPDETELKVALRSIVQHPISYIQFLSYLNKSAKSLLEKYFRDPEIFKFFDKLTSTYCYATVEEAPAILAAVMFVDNHIGGSYYPAGSTLFLPGKLEKVIEENEGDMLLSSEVVSIIFNDNKPAGVRLSDGQEIFAPNIIYSGTVWNLYGKLIEPQYTTNKEREWALNQVPTYPSVVMYCVVDKQAIPQDTAPIEMLVGNPDQLDESEVTAYILSIDDRTLCHEDEHTLMVIGPTFEDWDNCDRQSYLNKKKKEQERLISVLEKRFINIRTAIKHAEISTPKTIERYNMKNGGAVAGPKQMLGQHMFNRLKTRTKWNNLFCCGESTVMGTGTPTVTTSGLSAANALLRKLGKKPFEYSPNMKNYVNILDKPFTTDKLFLNEDIQKREVMKDAMRCRFCENPTCSKSTDTDISGIMRRIVVGNFIGATKRWEETKTDLASLEEFENRCIWKLEKNEPVKIRKIITFLEGQNL